MFSKPNGIDPTVLHPSHSTSAFNVHRGMIFVDTPRTSSGGSFRLLWNFVLENARDAGPVISASPLNFAWISLRNCRPTEVVSVTRYSMPTFQPMGCAVKSWTRSLDSPIPISSFLSNSAAASAIRRPAATERFSATLNAMVGWMIVTRNRTLVELKRPCQLSGQSTIRPNGVYTPSPILTLSQLLNLWVTYRCGRSGN